MKLALFITLDNTLITTISKRPYAIHSEDWKFTDNILDIIKSYYDKGYKICIVCNQLQVLQGLTTSKAFLKKIEDITNTLEKHLKIKKNSICFNYCFESNTYRSLPNPGLVYELACEYDLDIINSTFIGSSYDDRQIINTTGIKTYFDITDI